MSNESKHTNGPWSLCGLDDMDGSPEIVSPKGNYIASVGSSLEDARLIAAAPDMLKALTEAERWITDVLTELNDDPRYCVYNEKFGASVRNKIINAIDKAGGKHEKETQGTIRRVLA
jgi:hypothetical protein